MPCLSQQIQLTNPFQVPTLGHNTSLCFLPRCASAARPRAAQPAHWGPSPSLPRKLHVLGGSALMSVGLAGYGACYLWNCQLINFFELIFQAKFHNYICLIQAWQARGPHNEIECGVKG